MDTTVEQDVRRGHYYEEFVPGREFAHHWGRTFTETDAIWFSCITTQLNPIYFNRDYARRLGFRDIPIHPLFVACTILGLAVEDLTEIGGPFLGIDDLEIYEDVYPGDTIYSETVVAERRLSRSRPGWGIVTWVCRGRSQNGGLVMEFTRRNMARCLEQGA